MKIIKTLLLTWLLTTAQLLPAQTAAVISGKVVNAEGQGIAHAFISLKKSRTTAVTNDEGMFSVAAPLLPDTILISHVNYSRQLLLLTNTDFVQIILQPISKELEPVNVNTGFQYLPKDRATGSFVQVDNALLSRRVSTNIIDRLQGVASGLSFNKGSTGIDDIKVRGRSTILSDAQPLIVLDNFAYEGSLESINPNDIESISILKDAAAASIWGTRAGNGVIVLTTKKGRGSSTPIVTFNANLSFTGRPDLFKHPNMSTSDLVNLEIMLFEKGAYNSAFANTTTYPATSPVAEILQLRRNNLITETAMQEQLDALRKQDIRKDYNQYAYHNALNQQYALSVSGNSGKVGYLLSVGHDYNVGALKSRAARTSVRFSNDFRLLKNLDLNTRLYMVHSGSKGSQYPAYIPAGQFAYESLKAADGQAAAITKTYREVFLEASRDAGFLDWHFRPLEDLRNEEDRRRQLNILAATTIKYKITPYMSIALDLQNESQLMDNRMRYMAESYFVRDMVNRYTHVNASNKTLRRAIPSGDILDMTVNRMNHQAGRFQWAYAKNTDIHGLNLIAGAEARQQKSNGNSHRVYGYNGNSLVSKALNMDSLYRLYPSGLGYILPGVSFSETIDRFLSYYFNGSYSYNKKYTLSFSARQDASNYFGVDANARSVPLWSVGGKWELSREKFYNIDCLPLFALRLTYGYSGNTNRNITAYPTASNGAASTFTNRPYAQILTPGNPNLRWEKTGMLNAAIDFKAIEGRISGSLEYYRKKGVDLIGKAPLDPTVGFLESGAHPRYTGNVANMQGEGWDLDINTINLQGNLHWQTHFLFSINKEKVTRYDMPATTTREYIGAVNSITPIVGKPLFAVYSYKWAGLDPQTGDPRGFLAGEVSKEYTPLTNAPIETLVYHGSARPVMWGALRNSFGYKQLEVSFNIIYKLKYYFKRPSIQYGSLFTSKYMGHSDYALRWQKPGDELYTHVPSLVYPETNSNRSFFYSNSEILIEKGDHIRLQDIRVDYRFSEFPVKGLKNMLLYAYINNLGLLWKANKVNLDPDFYYGLTPGRTYSVGLNIQF